MEILKISRRHSSSLFNDAGNTLSFTFLCLVTFPLPSYIVVCLSSLMKDNDNDDNVGDDDGDYDYNS